MIECSTHASPSSSESFWFDLLFLVALAPCDLDEAFGVVPTLLVDASFRFAADAPADEGEETGFVVGAVVGLVPSSSEESPPARASSSASKSAIAPVDEGCCN